MLSAQSRIAKLEAEMNSMKTSHKRARLDYERDVEKDQRNREVGFKRRKCYYISWVQSSLSRWKAQIIPESIN